MSRKLKLYMITGLLVLTGGFLQISPGGKRSDMADRMRAADHAVPGHGSAEMRTVRYGSHRMFGPEEGLRTRGSVIPQFSVALEPPQFIRPPQHLLTEKYNHRHAADTRPHNGPVRHAGTKHVRPAVHGHRGQVHQGRRCGLGRFDRTGHGPVIGHGQAGPE